MRLTFLSKIIGSSVLSALLIAIVGGVIFWNVKSMNETQKWVSHTENVISRFKTITSLMIDMETGQRGFLASGDSKFLEPFTNAKSEFNAYLKKTQEIVSDNPTQVARLEKVLNIKEDWLKIADSEMDLRKKLDAKSITLTEFSSLIIEAKGKTAMDELRSVMAQAADMEDQLNIVRKKASESTANATFLWILIGLTSSIVFGVSFSTWISYQATKQLIDISENIYTSGLNVSAGSVQLSATSTELSSSSAETSASLTETVSSIELLTSNVKINAENTSKAQLMSESTAEVAKQGVKEAETLKLSIIELAESSKKIEDIISVIDDIAFQTNLLALNAAVEAARAGEQGKGFAVVADAVRSLAQKSSSSAKEISSLVKENVSKSSFGLKSAETTVEILNKIGKSVVEVLDFNQQIAASSKEQHQGIIQISQALNQVDQSSHANAAASEEVSTTSEELSSQASVLSEMVDQLNLIFKGEQKTEATDHQNKARSKNSKTNIISLQKAHFKKSAILNMGPEPIGNDIKKVENF